MDDAQECGLIMEKDSNLFRDARNEVAWHDVAASCPIAYFVLRFEVFKLYIIAHRTSAHYLIALR